MVLAKYLYKQLVYGTKHTPIVLTNLVNLGDVWCQRKYLNQLPKACHVVLWTQDLFLTETFQYNL